MSAASVPRDAVVAGATGLVGSALLRLLVAAPEYRRVLALARRPLPLAAATLHAREAHFDALARVLSDVGPGADVFCCLGTTLRTAGSQVAFRAVDHGHVLALARFAREHQARRFLLVSALGADAASKVFYNQVKGEAERDVRSLELRSLVILQPSLLDGMRAESRPFERMALAATRPLRALIPRAWRPVRATDVAATMLHAARASHPPQCIASAAMHGAAVTLDRESASRLDTGIR